MAINTLACLPGAIPVRGANRHHPATHPVVANGVLSGAVTVDDTDHWRLLHAQAIHTLGVLWRTVRVDGAAEWNPWPTNTSPAHHLFGLAVLVLHTGICVWLVLALSVNTNLGWFTEMVICADRDGFQWFVGARPTDLIQTGD